MHLTPYPQTLVSQQKPCMAPWPCLMSPVHCRDHACNFEVHHPNNRGGSCGPRVSILGMNSHEAARDTFELVRIANFQKQPIHTELRRRETTNCDESVFNLATKGRADINPVGAEIRGEAKTPLEDSLYYVILSPKHELLAWIISKCGQSLWRLHRGHVKGLLLMR